MSKHYFLLVLGERLRVFLSKYSLPRDGSGEQATHEGCVSLVFFSPGMGRKAEKGVGISLG